MGCFASSPRQESLKIEQLKRGETLKKYEWRPNQGIDKINSPMNIRTAHFRSQFSRTSASKFGEERIEIKQIDSLGNYILENLFGDESSDMIFSFHLKNLTSEQKASFSEDNKHVLVFDRTLGNIEFFDLCKRTKTRVLNFDLKDFAISKGGSLIAGYSYTWTLPNRLCCLKYSVMYVDGKVTFEHVGEKAEVGQAPRSIFISNDEKYAGCVTHNRDILVFDITHSRMYYSNVKVNLCEITFLNQYFIGVDTETIWVFKIPANPEDLHLSINSTFKIDPVHRKMTAITCSDNNHFYTGSSRGFIQFWGLERKKFLMYSIESPHQSSILELLITKDSRYLLSRDNTCVNIWDVVERFCIKTIHTIGGVLKDMSLSRDNKYFLTVDSYRDVKIFNLALILKNSPHFNSAHFLSVNVSYVRDLQYYIKKMPKSKNSLFHAIACAIDYSEYEEGNLDEKTDCIERLQQRVNEDCNDGMNHIVEIDSKHYWEKFLQNCSKLFEINIGLFCREDQDCPSFTLISESMYPKCVVYLIKSHQKEFQFDLIMCKGGPEVFTGYLVDDFEAKIDITKAITENAETFSLV